MELNKICSSTDWKKTNQPPAKIIVVNADAEHASVLTVAGAQTLRAHRTREIVGGNVTIHTHIFAVVMIRQRLYMIV